MDIDYLINMYENELRTLKAHYGANIISDISNVKDRTEALAIQRFIANLKNLPNESKTVNRNEAENKFCECGGVPIKNIMDLWFCRECRLDIEPTK
jgi:hypothetical protein